MGDQATEPTEWLVDYVRSQGVLIVLHAQRNCHPVVTRNPAAVRHCPTCSAEVPSYGALRRAGSLSVDGAPLAKVSAKDWTRYVERFLPSLPRVHREEGSPPREGPPRDP